jgi:hypothetical protein
MDGAGVPEAPIDEGSNLGGDEDDVYALAQFGEDPTVDTEAQAARMEESAHSDFRGGVAPTSGLHSAASFGRRSGWCTAIGHVVSEYSLGMTSRPRATISSGGTALPIIVARAARVVSLPKSYQSGNVWSRAASCGVMVRRRAGCT